MSIYNPCPFCGSTKGAKLMQHPRHERYSIRCTCYARGPMSRTAAHAMEAWNRLTHAAHQAKIIADLVEACKAGQDLSRFAAALNWDGTPNTPEFLADLAQMIEDFQPVARAAIKLAEGTQ